MPPTPVLLFLLTALIRSSSAACYYPNGTDVTTYRSENNAYAPCNASAQESMCCRINLSPDSSKDHCRSDGLCDSPNHVYLWRESCTDPTWKSPHCQRLCLDYAGLDPFGASTKNNNVAVTQCDNGSFCCGIGNNGSTCCTEGRGVWMLDGKETKVNPNTSSSATASPSATSPAAATQLPTQATAIHHDNAGAIAGGVVGGVAAILLLTGVLYCVVRRRRRRNRARTEAERLERSHNELDIGREKAVFTELPPVERPQEADSAPRIEMDGGTNQESKHANSPKELASSNHV